MKNYEVNMHYDERYLENLDKTVWLMLYEAYEMGVDKGLILHILEQMQEDFRSLRRQ